MLPPGYKGAVPEGYYVYRSGTNNVFIFLRGFYEDPKNLTPAVALLEQTKIYPLNGKEAGQADGIPRRLRRSGQHAADQRRQRVRPLKQLVDSEGHQPRRCRLARHAGDDRHRQGPAVHTGCA